MWVKCWSQLRGYLFAAAPTSWKSSVKFSFGPRRCEVFWSQLRVPPELVHMYITCSCMSQLIPNCHIPEIAYSEYMPVLNDFTLDV